MLYPPIRVVYNAKNHSGGVVFCVNSQKYFYRIPAIYRKSQRDEMLVVERYETSPKSSIGAKRRFIILILAIATDHLRFAPMELVCGFRLPFSTNISSLWDFPKHIKSHFRTISILLRQKSQIFSLPNAHNEQGEPNYLTGVAD